MTILAAIGFTFFLHAHFAAAQDADSLEKAAERLKDTAPEKAELYINLARRHKADDPQKALGYLRRAINLGPEPETLAVAYGLTSNVFMTMGQYDSSLYYYDFAEKICVENRLEKHFSSLYLNRAIIYRNRSRLPEAFDNYRLAKEWALRTNNITNLISSMMGIASVYAEQKRHNDAIELYMQAKDTAEKYNQLLFVYQTRNNMANLYDRMKKHEEALALHRQNLEYAQSVNDAEMLAGTWLNIAFINQDIHKEQDAEIAFAKALGYADQVRDVRLLHNLYLGSGSWKTHRKQYAAGVADLKKSIEYAKDFETNPTVLEAYRRLADAYRGAGKTDSAFWAIDKYAVLTDSVARATYTKYLADAQTQFDTERQQMKIERQQEEIRYQRYALFGGAALLILTLALLLLVNQRNRYRKVVSRKLEEQNRQITLAHQELKLKSAAIEQQNEEILRQSEAIAHQRDRLAMTVHRLNELARFKEKTTAMVVHDLKNPLTSIIALSESSEGKQRLGDIAAAARQMLTLTLNLLDIQKFKDAKMELNCSKHSAADLISSALRYTSVAWQSKNLTIETDVEPGAGVMADGDVAVRVLVNLLVNAAKFSPPSSTIRVNVRIQGDMTYFEVKDSGPGIAEDKQADIFWQYDKTDAKAYAGTGSMGLGLTFCRLAVQSHGGQIGVQSAPGAGATFYFTLPFAAAGRSEISFSATAPSFSFSDLSPADKFKLRPFLVQLYGFNVYETSALLDVLNGIPDDGEKIQEWKKAVTRAIFSCDEVRFDELIRRPVLAEEEWKMSSAAAR
jgi:signal transduction histidine kinase